MKIESIQIKNFRSFSDEKVEIEDYACFVGANGAGKSTVLCALNIFFRVENAATDLTRLDEEDFHLKDTSQPIEIIVTFKDLSPEAQDVFSNYYRHGKLIISSIAHFDDSSRKADVKQYGQRLGITAFAPFFKAEGDGKKVGELKGIYADIRQAFDLPPPGTKEAMIQALREYEANHSDACELQLSEDQFYGVSKGANRLSQFVQWVYVPAVKDASTEQLEARNTALGKLLSRTVRAKTNFEESVKQLRAGVQSQYQELLDNNQHVLHDLSKSLNERLSSWAHPEATVKLEWRQDPEKSVRVDEPFARILAGEGFFEGELARFGHGLQRSYLLALLHELASTNDANAPRLILGCEEPELYQHPPQAKHLASVLQKLSKANSQILVSTHSPQFVSGDGFENVRMVRKRPEAKCSSISWSSYADIASEIANVTGETPKKPQGILAKIHQSLQPSLNEMFFCSRVIFVEGLEDIAYITSYLHLMDKWDDFRRMGCHLVPVGGKSELLQPAIMAGKLGIPFFIIFDSDANKEDKSGSRAKHEKDNKALLKLLKHDHTECFPITTIWGKNYAVWHSDIGEVVQSEIGPDWTTFSQKADAEFGHVGNLRKHTLHIGSALTSAWAAGKKSTSLERLCTSLIAE